MSDDNGVRGLGVLVIGAGTGAIGTAIAEGLRTRGARVLGSHRDDRSSAEDSVRIDVLDPASAHRGIAEAVERLDGVDAVINASGLTATSPSLETPLEEWDRVIAVNLTGAFIVAQAAARIMVPRGHGSLVLVASLCAKVGCDAVAAYAASKAGLLGMTRSLAAEWAPTGVRVNALIPGVFPTRLNAPRIHGTARGLTAIHRTPMGRFGDPDELVGAAALLAGRDGSFITGTEITVDGGFLAAGITDRPFGETAS